MRCHIQLPQLVETSLRTSHERVMVEKRKEREGKIVDGVEMKKGVVQAPAPIRQVCAILLGTS